MSHSFFCLTLTKAQKSEIDKLNAEWDGLTTREGLRRYEEIVGTAATSMICLAALHKEKVTFTISDAEESSAKRNAE